MNTKIKRLFFNIKNVNINKKLGFKRYSLLSFINLIKFLFLIIYKHKDYTKTFELKFGGLIGSGQFISFASCRMAFYAYLKSKDIKPGDHVAIQAFNCAAIPNAIIAAGAIPLYIDISPDTLEMSFSDLKTKYNKKIKILVLQNTLGHFNMNEDIFDFCRTKNISIIIDSCLYLRFPYPRNYIDFVDGILFSFDSTKPFSLSIGGGISIFDDVLSSKITSIRNDSPELPIKYQINILLIILTGRISKVNYSLFLFINYIITGTCKFLKIKFFLGFLEEKFDKETYNYPIKIPNFLLKLGSDKIDSYMLTHDVRLLFYKTAIKKIELMGLNQYIPDKFLNYDKYFSPLRIIMVIPEELEKKSILIAEILTTEEFLFKSPLACGTDLSIFNYYGNCPIAESISKSIINFPLPSSILEYNIHLQSFDKILNILK